MNHYRNTKTFLVLFVLASLALAPWAFAAPTGATVTNFSSERGSGTSATTSAIEGGNVTGVNISGTSITTRWAGFYGSIAANLELSDASSNIFYQWTVDNVTGAVVYAANGTVSDFSVVTNGNDTVSPSYLQTSAVDNFNNTFTQTAGFSTNTITLASTPYTVTYQNGASGSLRTYALADGATGVHIWAGEAYENATGFRNDVVDYQIIAPADSSGITYTFYLELP